ncbi:thiol reductant ABC exporter subunit CydD [Nocardioides sp. Soil777]|uniref:thiol reductant ABC exporter subunit CydD n=1 Tax=Nocardioides sp. Soil777 TaxID=1736409 RepID=UPI0009EA7EB0|nr:thiol reductant ABC exporter subunit CydD [Nocardioides sp. Soil777]
MRPLDPLVLPHLLPARRPLAVVVGAGAAAGLLTIAQAVAIGALVVELVDDPAGGAWHGAALALLVVVGLRTLVDHLGELASARAAARVSSTLRRRLLDAATQRLGTGGPDPDDLVLLATRGATSVEPYVTRYLPAMVLAATLPALTVVAIWWLDWLSGLIVLLTLPLVPVFAALVGMTTRDRAATQWRELGVLSGHFLDVVRGLPTLVAHRRAEAQVARIGAVTERYRRATVDTLRLAFASSSVLELVATLSVALVAVSVGLRLADATIGFETALVVLLLAPEAYWPLRRVGAEFHAAAEGTAALTGASEALAALEDGPTGDRVPDSPTLRLDDLAPGHPGSSQALTRALALDLPDRGLVAVAGPSGCGKSTLLQTLRGELAAYDGRVLVGGVDLADVDPAWWDRQVAWLPQRPWLAATTVRDNLRLGDPGAEDEALWRALASVELDDVVAAHPDGLDRVLGEDGAGLSAGQRARLAMARVLVADRPVVLLDEPTAHLDEATERVLLAAMRTLADHALVVVVAHRPQVLDAADRVVELLPRATEPAPAIAVTVSAPPTPPVAAEPDDVPLPAAWAGPLATLLGVLSTAAGVALTATAAWLITRASEHPPVLVLMVAIVGVRTFGIARPVLRHAERVLSHDVALHELAQRRTAVYAALVPLVPGALRVAGPRRGDLLTSVVDDVDSLLDARLRVRQPVVTSLAVGLLAVVLAWWWAPQAGAVLGLLVAVGALAGLLGRRGARVAEPAHLRHRARVSELVEEAVTARDELRQWQAAPEALAAVDAEGDALERAVRRSVRGVATGHTAVRLATGAAVVAVAASVPAGAVSPATLALLVLLPVALGEVLAPLADAGALSVRTDAARERLDRLASLAPLVEDPAVPAPLAPGPLVLDGVSAGWGPEPCLHEVDLALRPGERVAVCGPSGSGKSTLAALLVRHLDPSTGAVRIGGRDLRDSRLDDVRGHVGLASDDPHVFASSVCENVRLARPDATDAEVADALGRARLGAWVASLPHGMHTLVGSAGIAVSGGERARIGVARALLADAAVLVLDEPTAHLDTATGREVADVLLAARPDRTVVWITHGTVGLDLVHEVVDLDAPAVGAPGVRESGVGRVAAPA